MTDEDLRELTRAAESGGPADRAALLLARMRSGRMDPGWIEAAAYARDPGARIALQWEKRVVYDSDPAAPIGPVTDDLLLSQWLSGLKAWNFLTPWHKPSLQVLAQLGIARLAHDEWALRRRDKITPRIQAAADTLMRRTTDPWSAQSAITNLGEEGLLELVALEAPAIVACRLAAGYSGLSLDGAPDKALTLRITCVKLIGEDAALEEARRNVIQLAYEASA